MDQEIGHEIKFTPRYLICHFWLFCERCGTLKLLLTTKGSNSNYKFCHLFYSVSTGKTAVYFTVVFIFSEYLLTLLVASKYTASFFEQLAMYSSLTKKKEVYG